MLERVYIDNYRCLVNFELVVPDFAVLIGDNGSGKSVFLDALWAVFRFVLRQARCADAFPASSRTRWDNREQQSFELDFREEDRLYAYRLVIDHARGEPRVQSEVLSIDGEPVVEFNVTGHLRMPSRVSSVPPDVLGALAHESFIATRGDEPVSRFKALLDGLWLIRLQPSRMTAMSRTESSWLAPDGSNFASWYRHIAQTQPENLVEFFRLLEPLIPGFRTIKLAREGSEWRLVVVLVGAEGRYVVGFDELSDGQRVLIVLHAIVSVDYGRPVTLILDEPDNFVDMAEVQPFLVELSDRLEDIGHALVASHHPEVIDYLAAHQIIEFDRRDGGLVRMRHYAPDVMPGMAMSRHILEERIARER